MLPLSIPNPIAMSPSLAVSALILMQMQAGVFPAPAAAFASPLAAPQSPAPAATPSASASLSLSASMNSGARSAFSASGVSSRRLSECTSCVSYATNGAGDAHQSYAACASPGAEVDVDADADADAFADADEKLADNDGADSEQDVLLKEALGVKHPRGKFRVRE